MGDSGHRAKISALGDIPRNRSTGDFGVSASGEPSHYDGLTQKIPSSLAMTMGMASKIPDGGFNPSYGRLGQVGSQVSLHEADLGGFHQGGLNDYRSLDGSGQLSQLPVTSQSSGDALAGALQGLDVNEPEQRYGVSGLKRNPRSSLNLTHGTGLHIGDSDTPPEVQPRTLVIHGITPELGDEQLRADLEMLETRPKCDKGLPCIFAPSHPNPGAGGLSKTWFKTFGEGKCIQSLYTGLKQQGQIVVTYYDSNTAILAYTLLNGRKLNDRQLYVELQKSAKDAHACSVALFDISDTVSDETVIGQLSTLFGPVVAVKRNAQVAGCREVYFSDVRSAQKAIAHFSKRPTTIDEDTQSGPQPISRTAGMFTGSQHAQEFASRGWVDQNMRQELPRMNLQGQLGNNPNLVSLLNNTPSETLDDLVRAGYLSQQHGSSNSLAGSLAASGNYGSASNLTNSGAFGSSTNLPSAANHGSAANLVGDSEFGSSSNLKGSSNNLAGLSGMTASASHGNLAGGLLPGAGLGDRMGPGGITPQQQVQLAALREGLIGNPGAFNKAKRSMTMNDLYSLSQGGNQLSGMGGQYGGGQYDASELSGWGGAAQPVDLDTANLLAQAQAFDSLNGLGGLGLQRSVSALQLQQLHQQANQQAQQQQLLMQLASAYNNPQAINQMSNLRMQSALPLGFQRGKLQRNDDNLGGGRLSRRAADPAVEAERRAQQDRHYALDPDRVERGEDSRTTLMIKNIPNKYTQKMLLQTIDEQFGRQYDFFYLPIDFKNKCNVGYAFINMVQPKYILPLMARFNQRKWERFNSEKVCSISYARIQGKQQLVTHFQNSSLLHEDKRCRPILFKTDGELAGEQEPFPTAASSLRTNRTRSSNPDLTQESGQSSSSLNSGREGSREIAPK